MPCSDTGISLEGSRSPLCRLTALLWRAPASSAAAQQYTQPPLLARPSDLFSLSIPTSFQRILLVVLLCVHVCVCVYVGAVPLQLLYFFLSASASRKSLFSFSSSTSSKGVWFPKGLGSREFRCYALSALQYSFPNAMLDRGAFSITDYYKIMTTVTSAIQ